MSDGESGPLASYAARDVTDARFAGYALRFESSAKNAAKADAPNPSSINIDLFQKLSD
jgi:hypothetical protein